MTLCYVVFIVISWTAVDAKIMDNNVVGTPLVNCGQDGLIFEMDTDEPFVGQIYVRNEFSKENCKVNFKKVQIPGGSMSLKFDKCGMRRQRMLNPKGMAYSVTMMVKFHEVFVTSADQAYEVTCFYREMDTTVTFNMDVSEITTVKMQNEYPMPKCYYEIRKSGGNRTASFVAVGESVNHVFKCDNADVYGMLVKNCVVDDGKSNKEEIIGPDGCPKDDVIISKPEYSNGGTAAVAQATVFKYPDEPSVYFSCQILLCVKDAGQCEGITPPNCDRRRTKRQLMKLYNKADDSMEMDLKVQKLFVLDTDEANAIYHGESRNDSENTVETNHSAMVTSTVSNTPEQKIPHRFQKKSQDVEKDIEETWIERLDDLDRIQLRNQILGLTKSELVSLDSLTRPSKDLESCLGTGTVVAFSVVLSLVTLLLAAATAKLISPLVKKALHDKNKNIFSSLSGHSNNGYCT